MFSRDDIEDVLTKRYPIYKNTVSERNREIDNKFLTENEWYEKYNDLTNYKRKWYNRIVEEKIKEFNLNPIYVTAISMTYGFDTGVPVTLMDPSSLIAFRAIYDEIYRECALRMLGQICYDNSP